MMLRRCAMALALAVAAGVAWGEGPTTAKAPPAATKPALKTEIKLDTTEAALHSYFDAWNNMEYASIMACISISDPAKKKTVEMYINYYMWRLALERACIAKYGEEEGSTVLGHPRSLDKQFALDQKRLLQSPNVDIDLKDRKLAHVFLRVERDRPAGLAAADEVMYRDDYYLVNVGATVKVEGQEKRVDAWKIDYIKTQNLADPERADEVQFCVEVAYPKIAKVLRDLAEQVKKGDIKTADEVKDKVRNAWDKIELPEVKGAKDTAPKEQPADKD